MYYWRVFLWKDGGKSTEFSKNVVAPIFLEDKLDETLDTGEIVLKNMPIVTRDAFPPKTKFRLEMYLTADYSDEPRTWDMLVEHDDVEEYQGCHEICTHRIHLIEASVIAQGMHVDNIALTYELQDVTLDYRVGESLTDNITNVAGYFESLEAGYGFPSYESPEFKPQPTSAFKPYECDFKYRCSFQYVWRGAEGYNSLKARHNAHLQNTISLKIPSLWLQAKGASGGWDDVTEVDTVTTVIKKRYKSQISENSEGGWVLNGAELVESKVIKTLTCGPVSYGYDSNSAFNEKWRMVYIPKEKDKISLCHIQKTIKKLKGYNASFYGENFDYHKISSADYISMLQSTEDKNLIFETEIIPDKDLFNKKNKYAVWDEYEVITKSKQCPIFYEATAHVEWHPAENVSEATTKDYWEIQYNYGNDTTKFGVSSYFAKIKVCDLEPIKGFSMFLAAPEKYNCYKVLRKALLTCDTQFINNNKGECIDTIEYPIIIEDELKNKLSAHKVHETIFEQKNLWEVLLQVGYYLHAIPYLEFADDGTDRFKLNFKQLGETDKKPDKSNKITVFNSRNLSEYFSQYDSYVSNLFSPQNIVEEWIVPTTSDSSYLVSNDTAELHTKYNIYEVLDLEIKYFDVLANATDYIYEKSIYSILPVETNLRPSKGYAIYYELGGNKICGLNYVPPSAYGVNAYALKNIIGILFGISERSNIKFNNAMFHIKYRTHDAARIMQFRPDLENFVKNSSYEKYPHHEQYYGQQEKIIDSQRFSANLFGRLIREGNAIYQRQECADNNSEKKSGDLFEINGEAYYVTATENEYYPDTVLQKVTYSKNFNQLSNIVTIPSEPRFYEVSERSQVRREIRLVEFFKIAVSSKETTSIMPPRYLNKTHWRSIMANLIFGDAVKIPCPKFAYTRFKADNLRKHEGRGGDIYTNDLLFPKNEALNVIGCSDNADCIVPLLHVPLKDAIAFMWDMEDNYKAGDSIDKSTNGEINTVDKAYFAIKSVRYCDIMGRADLFDFELFDKNDWDIEESRKLPQATDYKMDTASSFSASSLPIALDKDNREALSFNYQISLLHEDSDFVTFFDLFVTKNRLAGMCLLNIEVSMLDETVAIIRETVVTDTQNGDVTFSLEKNKENAPLLVKFKRIGDFDISEVKSIVFYSEEDGKKYPCLARNVSKCQDEKKLDSWEIYPIFSE